MATYYNQKGQELTFTYNTDLGKKISQFGYDIDGFDASGEVDYDQVATTTPPSAISATGSGGSGSGSGSTVWNGVFGLLNNASAVWISQNQKDTAQANAAAYAAAHNGASMPAGYGANPPSTGKTGLTIALVLVGASVIVITIFALKSSKAAPAAKAA